MPNDEVDAGEREQLSLWLQAEVLELDVHALEVAPGGATPAGSKGSGEVVTAGAIVLALSAPGAVLTSLVALAQDWLGRQSLRHRITITVDGDTLELEQATPEERLLLIEAFVRRHGAGTE
jgi:hypothetical protein